MIFIKLDCTSILLWNMAKRRTITIYVGVLFPERSIKRSKMGAKPTREEGAMEESRRGRRLRLRRMKRGESGEIPRDSLSLSSVLSFTSPRSN